MLRGACTPAGYRAARLNERSGVAKVKGGTQPLHLRASTRLGPLSLEASRWINAYPGGGQGVIMCWPEYTAVGASGQDVCTGSMGR